MVQPKYSPISQQGGANYRMVSCALLSIVLCVFVIYGVYASRSPGEEGSNRNYRTSPDFIHTFLSLSSNYTLAHYLRSLTLHPHLAGSPPARRTADFVRTHFESLGLSTNVAEYQVLLSYPVNASLSAQSAQLGTREFALAELGRADPGVEPVVSPYHAYSSSGSAQGKAVFVNYGREEDYRALDEVGVNVTGCVVVARRGGGVSRGGVARLAAGHGASAVLTYDEGDKFRDAVERGTVMRGVGDPLTPGWPSVVGGERLRRADEAVVGRFPAIPSMPISVETAEVILKSLGGSEVPQKWRGTLRIGGVGRVGPGPTVLNFSYQGEERMATIQDLFVVIKGAEEPDRYVLLGNHRDAWTYGAVDPNSGTAALLDIARRLAFLMRSGWKPRRTIMLCSWDAEEFGMIGSTEWVEENLINLGSNAVAYLNVDCAAQGPGFFARSTPQLDDLLVEVTKEVKDPEAPGRTVYEQWASANGGINIERLTGVDSDYASFLQHAGVPSLDMYYGEDFAVYHTAYDSYDWMATHADPFFHRHVAVAELWGLLALRLADDPILPFNYLRYAAQLQEYTSSLSGLVEGRVSIAPITSSINQLLAAAKGVQGESQKLLADEANADLSVLRRRMLNDRLMLAERALLDPDGVQTMEWFKHLVYGPSGVEGEHNLTAFPSIVGAISRSEEPMNEKDRSSIQHEVWRVSRAIQRAADALSGLSW